MYERIKITTRQLLTTTHETSSVQRELHLWTQPNGFLVGLQGAKATMSEDAVFSKVTETATINDGTVGGKDSQFRGVTRDSRRWTYPEREVGMRSERSFLGEN